VEKVPERLRPFIGSPPVPSVDVEESERQQDAMRNSDALRGTSQERLETIMSTPPDHQKAKGADTRTKQCREGRESAYETRPSEERG
jgi:hypothetical protein